VKVAGNILSGLFVIIVILIMIFIGYKIISPMIYAIAYESKVVNTVEKYVEFRVKQSCLKPKDGERNVQVIRRQ
jgi:hypothetical protein